MTGFSSDWMLTGIEARNAEGPIPDGIGPFFNCNQTKSAARLRTAYTLKDEPQPQVLFTWGLSNLKPAASSVST